MSQLVPPEARPSPQDDASGVRPSDGLGHPGLSSGVRCADPSDAHDVAWVQALSWQFALEQRLIPRGRPPHDFYAEVRRWGRRIVDGPLPVLVSLWQGQLVGYVALVEDASAPVRAAVVQSAHALPAVWTHRAAQNLVVAACDWLTQRSFRRVAISVLAENSAAQWFLTQNGFRLEGTVLAKKHLHNRFVKAL
jgi:RimJ/RimL family protein N-acetyltransferase